MAVVHVFFQSKVIKQGLFSTSKGRSAWYLVTKANQGLKIAKVAKAK